MCTEKKSLSFSYYCSKHWAYELPSRKPFTPSSSPPHHRGSSLITITQSLWTEQATNLSVKINVCQVQHRVSLICGIQTCTVYLSKNILGCGQILFKVNIPLYLQSFKENVSDNQHQLGEKEKLNIVIVLLNFWAWGQWRFSGFCPSQCPTIS